MLWSSVTCHSRSTGAHEDRAPKKARCRTSQEMRYKKYWCSSCKIRRIFRKGCFPWNFRLLFNTHTVRRWKFTGCLSPICNRIGPDLLVVAHHILLALEGLGADLACEKPLTAMDVLLMDPQVAAVGEGLQAGLAAVNQVSFDSVVGAIA